MKRRRFIAGTVLALTTAAALGPLRATPSAAQPGPVRGQPPEQLAGDEFDRAFLMQMTMHHAMGVVMTKPVATNAERPELKDLGDRIVADQTREIDQMRAWMREWYGVDMPDMVGMMEAMQNGRMPVAGMPMGSMPMGPGRMGRGPMGNGMPGPGGPGGPGQTPGMGGMSMMADLWELPPSRLEAVFMTLMIPHHQGAIELADLAPGRAAHPELVDFARRIVESQSVEIGQMNVWLAAWYGL